MEELLASQNKKLVILTRGQEVEGEVVFKSEREIIVDLGTKAEGVIPSRDIPPAIYESLKVGDQIKAYVVESENESHQVVLSMQKTKPTDRIRTDSRDRDQSSVDFSKIAQKYPVESTNKGTVTKITQFGVFVQLEEGIEGLIHISKLGPDDNFETGQSISVSVDSVDVDKRRISLVPVITSTKGLIYK
jgi:small subunit ribosomal protein S1